MQSGIYKLCWTNCEHFYFGQSINVLKRYRQHILGIKNGWHYNKKLIEAARIYGLPKLEIMELCPIKMLTEREQFYLTSFFNNPYCCNLSPTAETQKGIKRSAETIERIRISRTGTTLSQVHKKNISIAGLNRKLNGYVQPKRFGNDNPFFGKKHTEETRSRMRGRSHGVGANNVKAKIVINLDTGIFYDCAEEAANASNLKGQYLRGMLNGNKKNKTSFIYA